MPTTAALRPHRRQLFTAWERYVSTNRPARTELPPPEGLRPEIISSWERSSDQVTAGVAEAPMADPGARILWTCEESVMRRRAHGVNFVPGGRWDESSVGTNALDLALRIDAPATVYAAEHFSSWVHDWTCWAAPVHDPATGRQLGVLDLSTTWDRSHPMGTATAVAFARLLEQ